MGRLSWIIHMGPKCNYQSPHKRGAEGDVMTGDVTVGAETGVMCFEDGGSQGSH